MITLDNELAQKLDAYDAGTLKEYPYKVIGNPDIHDQCGKRIVTGNTDFAADHFTGHKFFGAIKGAEIMHGKILSIDTSEAAKIPGVKGFITPDDLPNYWSSTINRYGQEIVGVIADNWYTATRATAAVKVEYEQTAGVFDPDEAAKEGAPLSGVFPAGNVETKAVLKRDPENKGLGADAGWDSCEYIGTYEQPWTTTYAHNELEAHQTLAWWIGDDVYYYTGTQDINYTRQMIIAQWLPALGLSYKQIHAVTHFNCGGFGGKSLDCNVPTAIMMSKKVNGYPVLCKNSRQANMLNKGRQFSTRSKFTIGCDKTGKLVALDAYYLSNAGAALACPSGDVHYGLRTTYKIPYCSIKVDQVYTNAPLRHYWRDVADIPGSLNTNTALEKFYYDIREKGIFKGTPYEFRIMNLNTAEAGDQDYEGGQLMSGVYKAYYGWTGVPSPYSKYWGSYVIKDLFKKCHDMADYDKKWKMPHTQKVKDIYPNEFKEYADWWYGISITGLMDSHGVINGGRTRGGIVKVNADGTFTVITASARGCSGGSTVCCNVVAEVLGVTPDKVVLGEWGNTDCSVPAGLQAGSSHTVSISTAFYNTAMLLRNNLFKAALQATTGPFKAKGITSVDELEAEDNIIYWKKDHSVMMAYASVCATYSAEAASSRGYEIEAMYDIIGGTGTGLMEDGRIKGGAWRDKGKYIKRFDHVTCNGQSSGCAEVAVDGETGEVELLKFYNVVDAGTVIFRKGAEKEICAGCENAHNIAFSYGDIYDENTGALISSQYTEACLPTYKDLKTENNEFFLYESRDAGGPFGCHGIAEPSVQNYNSVFLAIYNAIGVWMDPEKGAITPDRVLKQINRAAKKYGYDINKSGDRVKE
jgi:CO/xanthine dehydrogenase Mo-binding subunit